LLDLGTAATNRALLYKNTLYFHNSQNQWP
jgi:hypothetical protein